MRSYPLKSLVIQLFFFDDRLLRVSSDVLWLDKQFASRERSYAVRWLSHMQFGWVMAADMNAPRLANLPLIRRWFKRGVLLDNFNYPPRWWDSVLGIVDTWGEDITQYAIRMRENFLAVYPAWER